MHKISVEVIAVHLVAISLLNFSSAQAEKREWLVPEEEQKVSNPVSATQDSIAAGKKIYQRRCEDCHGTFGAGDGPDAEDLLIEPSDLRRAAMRQQSDGALAWKIKTGKKPMPKYGSRLSQEEIWSVVNYLRTFTASAAPQN